jgi:5'-nucleotidase (lipoprotein e(P4) family)
MWEARVKERLTFGVIGTRIVAAVLLSTLGCAQVAQPPQTPQPPAATAAAAMPDSIRWVRTSAEFRAAFLQTYRAATARVDEAAKGRRQGTWAVVLDADETIVSNLVYQEERARAGLPFTAESWREWVARREATPLPGAAEFLGRVRALGGHIAIVTNRLVSECPDTEAVFKRHKLAYDAILCRPDGGPGDKNPRFDAVAQGRTAAGSPMEVLAFVGDNIQDFPGLTQEGAEGASLEPFGHRYFILPNPMYGSWQ